MKDKSTGSNPTVLIDTQIDQARVLALRRALKLELKGMKRRGRSAYAIVKSEFKFRGNKQRVLDQLELYIHKNILNLCNCPSTQRLLGPGCTFCRSEKTTRMRQNS